MILINPTKCYLLTRGITDLKTKIVTFLQAHGKVYTRNKWIQKYDPSSWPSTSGFSSASVQWLKNPKSGKLYYINPKTKKTI